MGLGQPRSEVLVQVGLKLGQVKDDFFLYFCRVYQKQPPFVRITPLKPKTHRRNSLLRLLH